METKTYMIYDDGTRKFTCTFTNCSRGDQNVVYRVQTDDGKIYIGNAGLEGLLGRLRQYPHEDSYVWNGISQTDHCKITVLGREFDTKKRYILENKHIYNEAIGLLRKKGYNGKYSPRQVNMLMSEVSDSLINRRLDRCNDLSNSMRNGIV